jgi:hypothetical protein
MQNKLEEETLKFKLRFALSLCVFAFVLTATVQHNRVVASSGGGPKASIATLEHSFGVVKPGTPLNYKFEIKNAGDAKLEITNVAPSCGCTTSDYDRVIEPGKTGQITLSIQKTDGYKGEVVKTATVTTNDPNHTTFTLTLRAEFKAE